MKSLVQIKKAVQKVRSGSGRARYPEDLKRSIVDQIFRGEKISHISSETGISHQALRTWITRYKKSPEVVVHRWQEEEEKVFRLHYPDGRWVDGLNLEDLKALRVGDAVSQKGA